MKWHRAHADRVAPRVIHPHTEREREAGFWTWCHTLTAAVASARSSAIAGEAVTHTTFVSWVGRSLESMMVAARAESVRNRGHSGGRGGGTAVVSHATCHICIHTDICTPLHTTRQYAQHIYVHYTCIHMSTTPTACTVTHTRTHTHIHTYRP